MQSIFYYELCKDHDAGRNISELNAIRKDSGNPGKATVELSSPEKPATGMS
jgi:hypothetical protein